MSPTDVVAFLECRHLTDLSRQVAEDTREAPTRRDAQLDVIQQRGLAHRSAWHAQLVAAGYEIADANPGMLGVAGQRWTTEMAMRHGADVIVQGTFLVEDGGVRWRGHADFLHRTDGFSRFGEFHYRPGDTKLARHVKPSAVLQLCAYADMLERVQRRKPDTIEVVLGGQEQVSLRTDDFMAYYRTVKRRFLDALTNPEPTYPLLVQHC